MKLDPSGSVYDDYDDDEITPHDPDDEIIPHDPDDQTTPHNPFEDSDMVADNDPDVPEECSAAWTTFADTFSLMKDDHKWILASGRVVEDVILEACQAMDLDTFKKSTARLFVIDMSDPTMESWFSEIEWKEIRHSHPATEAGYGTYRVAEEVFSRMFSYSSVSLLLSRR